MASAGLLAHAKAHGQHVDLTARIQDILRSYPEGTAIIKEL